MSHSKEKIVTSPGIYYEFLNKDLLIYEVLSIYSHKKKPIKYSIILLYPYEATTEEIYFEPNKITGPFKKAAAPKLMKLLYC